MQRRRNIVKKKAIKTTKAKEWKGFGIKVEKDSRRKMIGTSSFF